MSESSDFCTDLIATHEKCSLQPSAKKFCGL